MPQLVNAGDFSQITRVYSSMIDFVSRNQMQHQVFQFDVQSTVENGKLKFISDKKFNEWIIK